MSISSALNNAMAGLRVAGRASEVIASNISNATTPGYARRTLETASTTLTNIGGVTITGVRRMFDPGVLMARRDAQADQGFASAISTFVNNLESSLGTPDDARALTNRIADFDAALLNAASRPDAPERLDAALNAASDLVTTLRTASEDISDMRTAAERSIDAQVTRLNSALQEVEYLNVQIAQINISGQDDSSLQDMRRVLIDEIHEMVPVREAARDNGQLALYSEGGVILLDGSAMEIEFSAAYQVTPYMTQAGGQLETLSINGRPVRTGQFNAGLPGGTLAAQFNIRDTLGEDAMAQIDAVARDLVERFQDPAVDGTLLPGDAGFFTDEGGAFDPLNEVGLASRLTINASVDPDQGGEAWRLRDGMNAVTPGAVGQSALIDAMRDALSTRRVPASGDFGTSALSSSDIASSLMGRVGVQRLSADQSLTFAASTFHEMSQAERADGVDTDAELQSLLLVEQNYAANARMIETINEMMDTLLRIGS